MAYDDYELSVDQGEPVELYRFVYHQAVFNYTSADEPLEYNGDEYLPTQISRTSTGMTEEIQRNLLDLNVPFSNPIAQLFIAGPPEGVISLTVFRRHRPDAADHLMTFKGRVISCNVSESEATLGCEPIFTSLNRPGLRRIYDGLCPYDLYDFNCKAIREEFELNATVLSLTGVTVIVQSAATFPDGWFTGGLFVSGLVRRLIVNHQGALLDLMAAAPDSVVSEDCIVYPGCDRTRQQCNDKFNNILNYGGWPWLPVKNPFTGDNVFWG